MPEPGRPQVGPIAADDIDAVGVFMHRHLNGDVSPVAWSRALRASWISDAPNHGFQLTLAGQVVGAYLAIYSTRWIDRVEERFCNLAAWCVLEEYRSDGLRLLRALLSQRGYTFTDLSPSGNVISLNERLGFNRLDTTTSLVPALPWRSRGVTISSDGALIDRTVNGSDGSIRRDHSDAPAAHHVVLIAGAEYCYVVLRRDRRKGIPGFGSLLYVSNPNLLRRNLRAFVWHLLTRHRIAVLLAEHRIVGGVPRGSIRLRKTRPKMFRSDHLHPDQIDYLYSELTSVAW
jgi:hypothetical protein